MADISEWQNQSGKNKVVFEMEAISTGIEYCLSGERNYAYLNLYGTNYRHK